MDHHNGRTSSIAWPDIDDVEACTGDLDNLALRGICARRASTPTCVISARTASAATTTTAIIENVRMSLGTNELRFWGGPGFAAGGRSEMTMPLIRQ
jgi:hypothetical protein